MPDNPKPTPIDWQKYSWLATPASIVLGFAILLVGPRYLPSVDPTPGPFPPAPVVVEPVKPTLVDSIARRNGVRDDSIKAPLVELTKIGNGTYTLTFEPDKQRPVTWTVVITGGGVDPLPPKPDDPPVPPGPRPDDNPPPIPNDGFRVMIVYENNPQSEAERMTKEQQAILGSPEVRNYLDSKCPKGQDGKTPEWRFFEQHDDLANESNIWKLAMQIPRKSLPWIVISDGKTGTSVPLPKTVAETMALLKKYGGN